jgi:hypothetical protein
MQCRGSSGADGGLRGALAEGMDNGGTLGRVLVRYLPACHSALPGHAYDQHIYDQHTYDHHGGGIDGGHSGGFHGGHL